MEDDLVEHRTHEASFVAQCTNHSANSMCSNLNSPEVPPSQQTQMTSSDTAANNKKQAHLTEEMVISQEIDNTPDSNQPDAQDAPSWWQMACQFSCLVCKTALCADEKEFKTICKERDEEQFVVKLCCSDTSTNKRFPGKINEQYISCPDCNSDMVRLPYCGQFQPDMRIEHNIFDCVNCSKYLVACTCSAINRLPPKSMSWRGKKFNCGQNTIHCNCGRITYQDLKSKCNCPCGFDFVDHFCIIFFTVYVLCHSKFEC